MTRLFRWTSCAALAVLLWAPALHATTVRQMDLGDLVDQSERVLRGTVVDITPGTVHLGGADLPTVTYSVRVEEAFKGDAGGEKGVVDLTMVTFAKEGAAQGAVRFVSTLPGLPDLDVGSQYVLFTTRPSVVGLSTFVGLGQGSFDVYVEGKSEMVVNKLDNAGLIEGRSAGPLSYQDLAAAIRAELAE